MLEIYIYIYIEEFEKYIQGLYFQSILEKIMFPFYIKIAMEKKESKMINLNEFSLYELKYT